ncbi:MAG TPA: hypothetical protein VN842_04565 [Thermoplasmata archaeon]|nr:hypothetical protein [Thermoplasmata archaeon]
MSLSASLPPEPDWHASVTVREDTELARELTGRLRPPGSARRTSVTDLLYPRPAFWRFTVGPPPMTPEREVVLEGGRRLHRILGLVFAPEGQLEVRVHDDRVQGRVDVLSDRPIEIKTSAYAPPSSDPTTERPEHVDQVAMYSALLGVDTARLVYLQTQGDEIRGASTFDLRFGSVDSVRTAMGERVRLLSQACATGSAAGLPRCPWYARGCEYRGAGVCDCTGDEAAPTSAIAPADSLVTPRPDLALRLEEAARARLAASPPAAIRRFRDLLYPRRAFFEATVPLPAAPGPPFEAETDTYSRLVEALDCGPLGEATRLPTLSDEPDEEVGGFRRAPVLVRTSRSSQRHDPRTVVERSPQYALQLGFRCVATGTDRARLVLGYEKSPEAEKVQVLEYRFAPAGTFSRVWRARTRRLEAARAQRDPTPLEPCPPWMFEQCPYRDRCGCGTSSARSQR